MQAPLPLASVKTVIACRRHPATASQWNCLYVSCRTCINNLNTLSAQAGVCYGIKGFSNGPCRWCFCSLFHSALDRSKCG